MMVQWLTTLILLMTFGAAASAGEGANGERAKEPPPPAESKKKQEAEPKSDAGAKPSAEDKASKTEEPAQAKQEDVAKKPVTSPNLTIKLALMADPLLFPLEVEVEMDNRKAVLTGNVPSEEEKVRAADLARKIEGVESVVNKLTVSPALRATLTKKQDETVAHFVRDRLVRSETLKAVGFEVKSENGVVYLSGKTRFQVIALEAAEAARQVPGVRAVDTTGVQILPKD